MKLLHFFHYLNTIFIFPSLYEGFGNVITEAMVCETSVIAADSKSGSREILHPKLDLDEDIKSQVSTEYGVLLPSFVNSDITIKSGFDELDNMWIDAIENLLNNDKLQKKFSINGNKRVQDFSIEKITPQYEKVLRHDND